jgi:hypothetical protein
MSIVETLAACDGAPAFAAETLQCLVLMGSHAFGTANETSDRDFYGWCVPPAIERRRFQDFTALGAVVEGTGELVDFKIYNVNRFIARCAQGGSQALEMLFVDESCVVHCSPAAQLLREQRAVFLHAGTAREFRRFAFDQFDDMVHRRRRDGKRLDSIERYGYDLKAAYHSVRLMNEAHQLLTEGDLDLTRSREQLVTIRSGEWKLSEIVACFERMDATLTGLYGTTCLPASPDKQAIESLRRKCLRSAQTVQVTGRML